MMIFELGIHQGGNLEMILNLAMGDGDDDDDDEEGRMRERVRRKEGGFLYLSFFVSC